MEAVRNDACVRGLTRRSSPLFPPPNWAATILTRCCRRRPRWLSTSRAVFAFLCSLICLFALRRHDFDHCAGGRVDLSYRWRRAKFSKPPLVERALVGRRCGPAIVFRLLFSFRSLLEKSRWTHELFAPYRTGCHVRDACAPWQPDPHVAAAHQGAGGSRRQRFYKSRRRTSFLSRTPDITAGGFCWRAYSRLLKSSS